MRVLVVGGGIAGLTASEYLSKQGADVVLIEKSTSLGGSLQTVCYKDERGNSYLFDMGPHITATCHREWNTLTSDVSKKIAPLPKEIIKLNEVSLPLPLTINNFGFPVISSLMKYIPSYLFSKLFKKKESNLENALINQFGNYFYATYLEDFMMRFWKESPSSVSPNYQFRLKPPKLRNILLSHMKCGHDTCNYLTYPTGGFGKALKSIIKKVNKNVELKTKANICRISHVNGNVRVKIKEDDTFTSLRFDEIIWTGSLNNLACLLELPYKNHFIYRDLLLVYCAISKEMFFGNNVHCSYILIPNVVFHRIYEPKKLCHTMAPRDKTSVCMEITLNKPLLSDITSIVEKSLADLCRVFSLKRSEVTLLGFSVLPNAYPLLFVNYDSYFLAIKRVFDKKFKHIHFSGKLANYSYWNIEQTVCSALNTCNSLLKRRT
jgi:protoporphyrinogen oxidase